MWQQVFTSAVLRQTFISGVWFLWLLFSDWLSPEEPAQRAPIDSSDVEERKGAVPQERQRGRTSDEHYDFNRNNTKHQRIETREQQLPLENNGLN